MFPAFFANRVKLPGMIIVTCFQFSGSVHKLFSYPFLE